MSDSKENFTSSFLKLGKIFVNASFGAQLQYLQTDERLRSSQGNNEYYASNFCLQTKTNMVDNSLFQTFHLKMTKFLGKLNYILWCITFHLLRL